MNGQAYGRPAELRATEPREADRRRGPTRGDQAIAAKQREKGVRRRILLTLL